MPAIEADWKTVSDAFDRIVELQDDERQLALRGLPESLRSRVQRLLDADAREAGMLEQREEVLAPIAAGATPVLGAGWRIVELLGRGGMGEVWLAERCQGDVTQRVAVKLLKRGMDSDGVLRRFLQERRILAKLDHPAIAGLRDAGIAEDGRPFLAMDYIQGEPLIAYARRHNLSLAQRLELLSAVARAVDHAHRQLIVHRDLKPSNVLVDDRGQPHLLDFGIAKVLADDPDEITLTITGVRVLSPAYAAPEQVRGEDVGVAADVFGLGVLMYQLLVGRLPHQRSGRVERLADEIANEIAPLPSAAAAAAWLAVQSSPLNERVPWARNLRGDLDTIMLKAIHPEAQRRYASTAELADDIERHRRGRPISARPDSRWYRFAKFVHRHRVGVLAAIAAVLTLIVAIAITAAHQQHAIDLLRAENERLKAEIEALRQPRPSAIPR